MNKQVILGTVPSKHQHKQCLLKTVMHQLRKFETVLWNSYRKTDGAGILIVNLYLFLGKFPEVDIHCMIFCKLNSIWHVSILTSEKDINVIFILSVETNKSWSNIMIYSLLKDMNSHPSLPYTPPTGQSMGGGNSPFLARSWRLLSERIIFSTRTCRLVAASSMVLAWGCTREEEEKEDED